jgi:SAM-dependent methyltransferase
MMRRNRLAGNISALVYRWTYLSVVHRADADLFALLGDRLAGARVVDCGCGPGIMAEKLVRRGVKSLLAVDANASMVRQARARLAGFGNVQVRQAYVDGPFFQKLTQGADIVLFKRSLYAARPNAIETLRAAVGAIDPPGIVVVVHPERSLRPYAFGRPARLRGHTAFHLFNRLVSVTAARLGFGEYHLYRRGELLELLAAAAGGHDVVLVPATQHAYNIAAIETR